MHPGGSRGMLTNVGRRDSEIKHDGDEYVTARKVSAMQTTLSHTVSEFLECELDDSCGRVDRKGVIGNYTARDSQESRNNVLLLWSGRDTRCPGRRQVDQDHHVA